MWRICELIGPIVFSIFMRLLCLFLILSVCSWSKMCSVRFYMKSKLLLWRRNGDDSWERTVSWHLFLTTVSTNFFSILLNLVLWKKIQAPSHTTCAGQVRFTFRAEQFHDFSKGVKLTEVPVVQFRRRSRRSNSWRAIWKRVWLSSWKWRFFVKLCLVISLQ